MIGPFGMIAVLLSRVVRVVLRIPISYTCPFTHWMSTRSHILYGLNRSIRTHPAKLDSDHCNAIPMANHAAHSKAINEVVCTPNIPATEIRSITLSPIETRLERNLLTVTSILDVSNPLFTILVIHLIAQSPTTKVASAPTTVGAHFVSNHVASAA